MHYGEMSAQLHVRNGPMVSFWLPAIDDGCALTPHFVEEATDFGPGAAAELRRSANLLT